MLGASNLPCWSSVTLGPQKSTWQSQKRRQSQWVVVWIFQGITWPRSPTRNHSYTPGEWLPPTQSHMNFSVSNLEKEFKKEKPKFPWTRLKHWLGKTVNFFISFLPYFPSFQSSPVLTSQHPVQTGEHPGHDRCLSHTGLVPYIALISASEETWI